MGEENHSISLIKKLLKRYIPTIYRITRFFWRKLSLKLLLVKVVIGKKIFCNSQKLMINIGGGDWYKKNWKVLDFQSEWYSHNNHFIDYYYDLTSKERMPLEDNSVDLFYSEHTLEHISDECCTYVFTEVYRTLKPGGAFRIVVPDMDLAYQRFANRDRVFFGPWMEDHNATLTEAFLILFAYPREGINEEEVKYKFKNLEKSEFFNFYSKSLRQDPKKAGQHINWFNYSKLRKMLKEVGFDCIYKSTSQGSRFPEMRGKGVDTRPSWSLHIEAIKKSANCI